MFTTKGIAMALLLRKGDSSSAVAAVQKALGIKDDGIFGPGTETAVKNFQKSKGLTADGLVGAATFAALGLAPEPARKKLVEQDYIDAAKLLSKPNKPCLVNAIKAVAKVETSGDAFGANGLPVILWERHKFDTYLVEVGKPGVPRSEMIALRDKLRREQPELCLNKGKVMRSTYNKNPERYVPTDLYSGGSAEWAFMERGRKYSDTAALMSASFGMFQIMGFNYQRAGFQTVQAFVEAMKIGEREHLLAFVNFIKTDSRLWDALLALDWEEFARLYNGAGYKQFSYHTRMGDAFKSLNK